MTRPPENFAWNVHRNTVDLITNRDLEPFAIQVSGGRTSGYLLRVLLDLYSGIFPDTVRVLFQNTGLEAPETLDFVNMISHEWGVPITWLEHDFAAPERLKIVTYETASRDGRPFWDLFSKNRPHLDGSFGPNPLPSPGKRYCTAELKTHLANRYLRYVAGWPLYYYSAVGLRADEPSRVVKQREYPPQHTWVNIHPLYNLGVTAEDVLAFWRTQPFDLALDPADHLGNCVLCFLKPADQIKRNAALYPAATDLMIALEELPRDRNNRFRADRRTYRELRDAALAGDLAIEREDPFINDCACTG